MDTLSVEIKQAVRVFRRSPGFAAAVLVTLGIGVGGTTAIFSLVNGLLLKPIPGLEEPSRLVALQASEYGGAFGVGSYVDYLDFVERTRAFQALAAFKPRRVDVAAAGSVEPLNAAMVTSSYFDVLGVRPYLGRFFGPEVDQGVSTHPQVILTDGLRRRWFGSDASVLGTQIVLNGRGYEVLGVTPPAFRGTTLVQVPELFVPMTMQPDLMPESGYLLERRGWSGVSLVGRLADDVTREAAGAEIESIAAQLATEYPSTNSERVYRAVDIGAATVPGATRSDVVRMSGLLLAIVGALWLVVCLNVANLFLARAMKRRQELAVRLAMGAGRATVIRQLALEFMAVALAAGLVGMALARVLGTAVATLPLPVLLDMSLDVRTLLFTGVVALASGVICGTVPALTLSRVDPGSSLSSARGHGGGGRSWPSRLLVVSQVTFSVMLLFATGLFVRTFTNLSSADPGFEATGLLTAGFDPSLQGYDAARVTDFYRRLTEAALAIPGVEDVAMADALPAAGNFGSDGWFFENATEPERSSSIFFSTVSANFFRTLRIPIVAGRGFTDGDTPAVMPVLLVNEAGARLIEARTGRPPVGQRMSVSGPRGPFLEVVGVVGDSRTGRALEASPFVYGVHEQVLALGFGGHRMVVMLRTSVEPESLAAGLRRVAAAVDPDVAVSNITTMERFLDDLLAPERLTVTALSVSSALGLLLVGVGLYGLLAYVVARRTREFGIRMALGSSPVRLKRIVLREALGLAGAGLLLGVVGALGVNRFLSDFLVGVTPSDPTSMAAAVAVVMVTALAAAYAPAARATRADPVVAMRVE